METLGRLQTNSRRDGWHLFINSGLEVRRKTVLAGPPATLGGQATRCFLAARGWSRGWLGMLVSPGGDIMTP